MYSFKSNFFLVTLFICLYVRHASSIKCYDCETNLVNGTADAECKDNLGNVMTRDCQTSLCKIVVKSQENGESLITRSCGEDTNGTFIGGEVNSGKDHGQYTDNGVHVSWRSCTTDLCNLDWDLTHKHRVRRQTEDILKNSMGAGGIIGIGNGEKIKCYTCTTNILDDTDTTMCRQDMKSHDCYKGVCSILKFTMAGDEFLSRQCGIPEMLMLLPKNKASKNGKITRFGAEIAWSSCHKDECNAGVMNKLQMIMLYVSVVLSLSLYCRLF